jgi:hypothetical protein
VNDGQMFLRLYAHISLCLYAVYGSQYVCTWHSVSTEQPVREYVLWGALKRVDVGNLLHLSYRNITLFR